MEEVKTTLHRVILLIWCLAAVTVAAGIIVHIFVSFSLLSYLLGVLLGSGVSTLLMFHRFSALDLEMDLEEKQAVRHSKAMAVLRTLFALAALFAAFRLPNLFAPVTVFIGLFNAKAAALLYPVFFRGRDDKY